jgi:NTP pyrophosphatase (non-canonical NTP hydrolase)
MVDLQATAQSIHRNAVSKGFWDGPDNENVPTKLCLIHSEISEAMESHRRGEKMSWTDEEGKPQGMATELADAVIRILDLCAYHGINMEEEMIRKMQYNISRTHKHGGKRY